MHKAEWAVHCLQAAEQAVHNCARVGFRQSQLVRKAQEREYRRRLQEEQHCRLEQQLDAIKAQVRFKLLTGAYHIAEGCMCCMVQTEGPPFLTQRAVNRQAGPMSAAVRFSRPCRYTQAAER